MVLAHMHAAACARLAPCSGTMPGMLGPHAASRDGTHMVLSTLCVHFAACAGARPGAPGPDAADGDTDACRVLSIFCVRSAACAGARPGALGPHAASRDNACGVPGPDHHDAAAGGGL